MKAFVTALFMVAAFAAPALAQPALAPEADKTLWCASAFYWLAGSAEDSGEPEEAEMYDRWSKRLLDIAGAALARSGYVPEKIEEIILGYDEQVLGELGTPEAAHDITTCPDLLGDWR